MRLKILLLLAFAVGVEFVQAAAINDRAPAFTLKDTSGVEQKLADHSGEVVFVNFWASWCGPCAIEFPELNKLAEEYKDQKVRVIAINVDKKADNAAAFLKKMRITPAALTVLLDSSNHVVESYDVDAMPTSFVIDRQGVIRFIHTGYVEKDAAMWRNEIKKLLAEPDGK